MVGLWRSSVFACSINWLDMHSFWTKLIIFESKELLSARPYCSNNVRSIGGFISLLYFSTKISSQWNVFPTLHGIVFLVSSKYQPHIYTNNVFNIIFSTVESKKKTLSLHCCVNQVYWLKENPFLLYSLNT